MPRTNIAVRFLGESGYVSAGKAGASAWVSRRVNGWSWPSRFRALAIVSAARVLACSAAPSRASEMATAAAALRVIGWSEPSEFRARSRVSF